MWICDRTQSKEYRIQDTGFKHLVKVLELCHSVPTRGHYVVLIYIQELSIVLRIAFLTFVVFILVVYFFLTVWQYLLIATVRRQ